MHLVCRKLTYCQKEGILGSENGHAAAERRVQKALLGRGLGAMGGEGWRQRRPRPRRLHVYVYHSYDTTALDNTWSNNTVGMQCRAEFYPGSSRHWKRSWQPNVGAWVKLQRQNRRRGREKGARHGPSAPGYGLTLTTNIQERFDWNLFLSIVFHASALSYMYILLFMFWHIMTL